MTATAGLAVARLKPPEVEVGRPVVKEPAGNVSTTAPVPDAAPLSVHVIWSFGVAAVLTQDNVDVCSRDLLAPLVSVTTEAGLTAVK